MAAASGHLSDEDGVPLAFRQAVGALRAARVRPEIALEAVPAPKRLAPHAYALEASVAVEDAEVADGRLVLLYDPAGREAWHGEFRLVSLTRADLEPEMAADPLLPEVCWSWLTGALEARGAPHRAVGGTVSRTSSHHFGELADRPDATQIEVRASWTPVAAAEAGEPDLAVHLAAWCELLAACAGLPPAPGEQGGGVVPLPNRRGPH